MKPQHYLAFAREAVQITFLCLAVVAIFGAFGADNKTLLINFNIAVISSAVLYRHGPRYTRNIAGSCLLIGASISLGGIIGYYSHLGSEFLILLYAGLAFYMPKSRQQAAVFISGALMFVIFSNLSFDWQEGLRYLWNSVIIALVFAVYYRFLNLKMLKSDYCYTDQPLHKRSKNERIATTLIAVLSLSVALVVGHALFVEYHLPNIYWIEITILMVLNGSFQMILSMTMKRMIINMVGALVSVIAFGFILPHEFWIVLSALTVLLFLIFFTSFSYTLRVFFIELFVLGFAYLIGLFHPMIAVDRVILTVVGGVIVLASTLIIWAADKFHQAMVRRQPRT